MSPGVTGMLLGLGVAVGPVLVLRYAPPFRSVRLVDRLAPYVHDTPPPSRLLGTATEPGLLTAVRRVFGPAVGDGARLVDRMLGGRAAVRRRLDALATQSTTLAAYDSPLGTAILVGGGAVCVAAYRLMLRIGRLPEDVRVLQ